MRVLSFFDQPLWWYLAVILGSIIGVFGSLYLMFAGHPTCALTGRRPTRGRDADS